ncbi:hypothetical protein AAU57_14795, partial [Nonlabens sp. YIK11]|uniref:TonB-dependent receptor n=1 Tax=Nonlabens sp. YIK11 TaxID=1453349 RepID=UPI00070829E1
SEKVAINLKLKEDQLNVWFGNANLGLGTNERYEISNTVGLLRKDIKLFNLTKLNNISELAGSQVNSEQQLGSDGPVSRFSDPILNIDNLTSSKFSYNEDVFNNSLLNSFGVNKSLGSNVKLRSLTYYSSDRINKSNNSRTELYTSDDIIEYTENNDFESRDVIIGTDLELKYLTDNQTYYQYEFTYQTLPTNRDVLLDFNGETINQNQDLERQRFVNNLTVTKKISDGLLLNVNSYLGYNSLRDEYKIAPNIYSFIPGNDESSNIVTQSLSQPMLYAGASTEFINKWSNSNLGLKLDADYEHYDLDGDILLNNGFVSDTLTTRTGYQKVLFKGELQYAHNLNRFLKINSSISIAPTTTKLKGERRTFLFFNPNVGLTYKKNAFGTFGLNYSYNNDLPQSDRLNDGYLFENYRTIRRGFQNIESINSHNFSLRYYLRDYEKLFLINSSVLYRVSDRSYGIESDVSERVSIFQDVLLDGNSSLLFDFNFTRYLDILPISIKLGTQQSISRNSIAVNGNFEDIQSLTSNYRIQGTTYFKIPINFKFYSEYNFTRSDFNDQIFKNNYVESSIDLIYNLKKLLNLKLNATHYYINEDNFLFLNGDINYTPKKGSFSYTIKGRNLSDLNEFDDVQISSFQKRISSFDILPSYLLLNIKFRY